VTAAAGIALILAGMLAWVARVEMRGRRYFDRPAAARNPWFDPIVAGLHGLLLAAGLILLFLASPPSAAAAAVVLAAGWGYRRIIRSVPFRRFLLRRDFLAAKRGSPGRPDEEILFRLVMERHPRWGEELIEQMVRDHPTIEELARMMVRMERGFRGFR
jgi:hypothetical protein